MLDLIAAAALTWVGAVGLGVLAWRLCGRRSWTFLSLPVGLALLLLISMVAIHVPGHAATTGAVILVPVLAGLALLAREPELRPGVTDLMTAVPALFLVLLPFLANGRAGTLGVSFDTDMRIHLLYAEAIRSPAVAKVTTLSAAYPLGPHALCAVLAQATGMRVDYAFAGETMAVPVLLALTTLGALRRVRWLGKAFVATVSSLTFLYAAYYAEGAFKEIMEALFVLGFALGLQELARDEGRGALRWVPLALIVGGSLSVYSVAGLLWPVAVLGLWLGIYGARRALRGGSLRTSIASLRGAALPSYVAVGVLLVLLVPQLPRLSHFSEVSTTKVTELGNLAGWGAVSFWKVFGMWDVSDFRMPAADPFRIGMFAALGLALTVAGGIWWLRRGELAIPLAAGVAVIIWIYSEQTQSPYVAAKALVILAPLVMLIATRWIVESQAKWSLPWAGALRLGVAGLLGWAVLSSSVEVLRAADVGPATHIDELRGLQPLLGRTKTLFLGRDLLIKWELAGTPVDQPDPEAAGSEYRYLPMRAQKAWKPGEPMDFDELSAATLDEYRFIVTLRDPAGSEPPSNMRLLRSTRFYELWERVGMTPERQILDEGPEPGAVLDCATPQGQVISRSRGQAAIRRPNVVTPLPVLTPGQSTQAGVKLSPGTWLLTEPYVSNYPVDVSAPGLRVTLPANLDYPGPGPRWFVGSITVTSTADVTFTFHVHDAPFAPRTLTGLYDLVATPQAADRIVPLSRACGQYVDWYVSS